jgi:hypothetical protein
VDGSALWGGGGLSLRLQDSLRQAGSFLNSRLVNVKLEEEKNILKLEFLQEGNVQKGSYN